MTNDVRELHACQHPRDQRGFFDAGLGLALLALFSLTTTVLVSNEATKAEQQQIASSVATTTGDARPDVLGEGQPK